MANLCFKANKVVSENPLEKGLIKSLKLKGCDRGSNELCFIQDNYVWIDANLQFINTFQPKKVKTPQDSQFYNKLSSATCRSKSDIITTRLLAGRKCLYDYQCVSRVCDPTTNVCTGLTFGSSCSDHSQCDADLACRVQSVWPYASSCQPRGEVGSFCLNDFDCKSRNFCWKLRQADDNICLEKHNAPWGQQFLWDSTKYPNVTRHSILFHGQYCQSGYAKQVGRNISECVNVTSINVASITTPTQKKVNVSSPFACIPGAETCDYQSVDGVTQFSLACECSLSDGKTGYCPLPLLNDMKVFIKAIKQVWYQDNCHTYDRSNFYAQIDCGVGNNDNTLRNAVNQQFSINYFPYLHDKSSCLYNVLPDSPDNVFI
eukprot:403371051